MLGTTPTAVSSGDRSLPSVHGVLTVGFDGRACTVLGVRSRNGMGREEEEEAFSLLAKRWGNTCKLAGMIERTFCSGVAASAAAGGGGGGERGGEAGGGGGHFGSGGRSFCSSTAAAAGEGGGGGGGGGGGHFGSGGGIVITSDSAAAAMAKRGRKFGGKRQTVVTAAAAKPANQADSNLKTVEEKKAAAEEEDAVMEESKSLSARMKDVLNMKVSKQCKAKAPPFLTCRADDLVIDAVKKMNAGDVGSLVVVDANSVTTDYPMGIVTERDILKKVVAEGREPKTTKVGEVMTGKETLVVSTPDVSAYECMRLMAVHRIRHIPIVLGPEQKLVGIVSIRDMVETILREKEDVQRRLQNYISGIY
ncbi:hypothetical protein CBR_g45690 [Chara braunii]|uniref:CBS domain-containing protein n=1 Tax=Chara braunii TaxID=69332 RepID=A0A388K3N7_CHABU|nr:hypothetical protein CBR_g45690 [Chara braunii]|eukprot:GBG64636.1 hypothetical protein CBR_g45690 [Chara braunii]